MTMPPPPTVKKSGELNPNESGYILDTTLKDKHRKDPKVIAFIDSFVVCKSISQAADEAGITKKLGYSFRHRADIANAIQKIMDKSAVKYGFDSAEIFERVKEFVEFDPIMVQNCDGTFKSNMYDIEPEARRSIKKLKVKNLYNQVEDINGLKSRIIIGEVIEYEFYDKIKSAELVGREKEMFKTTNVVQHDVTKNMASALLASSERANERLAPKEVEAIDITPGRV